MISYVLQMDNVCPPPHVVPPPGGVRPRLVTQSALVMGDVN